MKTQIPIYRAKKIDSDEYVEGFYFNYDDALGYRPMIISKSSGIEEEIEESTLTIQVGEDSLSMQQLKRCVEYCKKFDVFGSNKVTGK